MIIMCWFIITQPTYPFDVVCLSSSWLYHFTHSVELRSRPDYAMHEWGLGLEHCWNRTQYLLAD